MDFFEREIFETIKSVIYPEYLNSVSFEISQNKGSYNSIIIEAKKTVYRTGYDTRVLFARIKTEGITNYISFSELQKDYIEGIFEYSKIKSDPFLRISVDEFLNKLRSSEEAQKAINKIFLSVFNFSAFGCCGRYKECSAAGKCIHPDLIYASACQYKKNLDEGKIFY